MLLAAFCKSLRSRWHCLSQHLWPDAPQQRIERELARLKVDLARRYRRLLQRRCRIEQVRDRLAQQEQQIYELSRQALAENGEHSGVLAESLQRLQLAACRNRDRLQEHEQAYTLQLQGLERRKHLRLALLRGDMVVTIPNDAE
jgi:hypothetical protein